MELFTTAGAKISLFHRQLAAGEADALLLLGANDNIQQSLPTDVSSVAWPGMCLFPRASQHLNLHADSERLSEHKLEPPALVSCVDSNRPAKPPPSLSWVRVCTLFLIQPIRLGLWFPG